MSPRKTVKPGTAAAPVAGPPDQADREAAVTSRGENLLVDAGAGTGKTTLLVRRLVELVAPAKDALPAVPLDRIAAVTFTRKAAGELKLRVRQRLLAELAAGPSAVRRERLAAALSAADTAFIGTIHGFADRLLRLYPVEAWLSPSYEVLEDTSAVVRETFEALLLAAEAGTLAALVEGPAVTAQQADEAAEAIRAALAAEISVETVEYEFFSKRGLDALVASFIEHRDAPPAMGPAADFPADRAREGIDAFVAQARGSVGEEKGSRFVRRLAARFARLPAVLDPVTLLREAGAVLRFTPSDMRKGKEFAGDLAGYDAWFDWTGYEKTVNKEKVWVPGYEASVLDPARRWLATRLVRAFPVVVALYDRVKARHRVVDQVDLLLMLRNLLRDEPAVRGELQKLFDHVFVDEFQDTDPLQAEIILYLCENGPVARRSQDVALAPGRLTLVGDPKQSIYRFRRADISTYDAVRQIVARGTHRDIRLTANFRSQPELITHLNDRYDEILGTAEPGQPDFDAETGTVVNRRLDAARAGSAKGCVAVLPFRTGDGKAGDDRGLEATVLATFLRARSAGGMKYGDVAILAHSTANVPLLTAELDRLGVPWSARGGTLFLKDPLHVRFLLGLRALADRDDGVAEAALLRAPFFAVDLADLVRARAVTGETGDEGVLRARGAREQVRELRRRRFERPPGETARDLLETTAFGRAVALGPNGSQRLARLRELCLEVDRLATGEGLDFDAVTARMREWVDDPPGLDAPRPVEADAVQIMTIHQAKGLEFPVVAWWDGRARMEPRKHATAWHVGEGGAWAMDLADLAWEEPAESGVLDRENDFVAAERRRLVYVAGTRARDLLVLPVASKRGNGFVTSALVGEGSPAVDVHAEWVAGEAPAWAAGVEEPPARVPREVGELAASVGAAWGAATNVAGKAQLSPRGISAEAHAQVEAQGEDEAGARWKERKSRFGNVFGETVHVAVGAALREPGLAPEQAVARVRLATELDVHLDEAAADVRRALAALEREGLRRVPGPDLRLEYPVALGEEGRLLLGYVDLLAARDGTVTVIDFKTDAPPTGDVRASHPDYVAQVREYGRILVRLGVAREGAVRHGLLFTGDGVTRWV